MADVLNVTEAQTWVTEPIPNYVLHADIFIVIIYFAATVIGKKAGEYTIFSWK